MDIWSHIFAEKFRIFKVCVGTDRGEGSDKCGQVWAGWQGVKNTKNVWISFMDGPKTRCLNTGFAGM